MPARTDSTDYPKKLFYRIQEVAEITGLKPYVLRYWETQFDELKPEKAKNDQRRYRQSDIEMALRIKDLLYEQKFTIAGARQSIKASGSRRRGGGVSTSSPVPGAPAAGAGNRKQALQNIRAELRDIIKQLDA